MRRLLLAICLTWGIGCTGSVEGPDAGGEPDGSSGTDAGDDSGYDAGHDAGYDAGHDAGYDAGEDAGNDAGYDAGGDDAGGDAGPDSGDLFAVFPSPGRVEVILHPGETVTLDAQTLVAFGIPFPRNQVADIAQIRVTDAQGAEIAAHVRELARWRSLTPGASVDSVRAALVFVNRTFADRTPVSIYVAYGETRTQDLPDPGDPRDTWVPISSGSFPDEYPAGENIREPAVYASLPADWLSACLLRTRTTNAYADADWQWFDDFLVNSARTAVNDVDPRVTALIDYLGAEAPWLFDRAMTLFGVYVRTGDVKWLRHAHRAAQFYAGHLDANGYFDMKSYEDLKYSYGQCLFVDLMLTGDTSLLDPIDRVASACTSWNPVYTTNSNFWTERHQTYALLGALSAWEATGDQAHADRVREIAEASFAHALNPPGGWPTDGCLLHQFSDHEGAGTDDPVCSPWMSALFTDAIWRYYLHSEDSAALTFLAGIGDYVRLYALYLGQENLDRMVPWYLVSSVYQFTSDGPWGDMEHACDVAGLLAKAAWARKTLGEDHTDLLAAARTLLTTCEFVLDYWHRPGGPDAGLAEWRLNPPRKFNWWFGTTLDLQWLLVD